MKWDTQKELDAKLHRLNQPQNQNCTADIVVIKQLEYEIILWLEQTDKKWKQ